MIGVSIEYSWFCKESSGSIRDVYNKVICCNVYLDQSDCWQKQLKVMSWFVKYLELSSIGELKVSII